jgi:hypothetical protein
MIIINQQDEILRLFTNQEDEEKFLHKSFNNQPYVTDRVTIILNNNNEIIGELLQHSLVGREDEYYVHTILLHK